MFRRMRTSFAGNGVEERAHGGARIRSVPDAFKKQK